MKKRYLIAVILTCFLLYYTHHVWLGHKQTQNFDVMFFIIVTVTGYLINLKLTSYIADFKTIKNQSRTDIIFLTIFFILLFIPMLRIDRTKVSATENRTLAERKALITTNGKVNLNFGKDYNEWFNDRFLFRNQLIKLNITLQSIDKVVRVKKAIYVKNTNWMFLDSELNPNIKKLTKSIDSSVNELDKLNTFCNEHNIKLYVLIVPSKSSIYQNYTCKHYNKKANSIIDKIYSLKQNTKAKVIFPYNELKMNSKKEMVFFKTDWHWTDYGAYIGYLSLMEEIHKDYPKIKTVNITDYKITKSNKVRSDFGRDYHQGENFKYNFPALTKYADKILDTKYKYFEHHKHNLLKVKITNISKHKNKEFYFPDGNNLKVIEIGTSMNENLTEFTPYTFKNLKYIRLNNVKERSSKENFKIMKYYKNEILNYKPDILIFCITQGNLNETKKIFEEE